MRVLQQTTQTGSVWDCPAGRSNEERGTEGDKNCSGEIFHECVSVKKNLCHLMQWLTLLCENQSRASSRCWILHFSSCEFNCMRCSKKIKALTRTDTTRDLEETVGTTSILLHV